MFLSSSSQLVSHLLPITLPFKNIYTISIKALIFFCLLNYLFIAYFLITIRKKASVFLKAQTVLGTALSRCTIVDVIGAHLQLPQC